MEFRFNFNVDADSDNEDEVVDVEPMVKKRKTQNLAEFKEIKKDDYKNVYPWELEVTTYKLSDDISVHCYDAGAVEEILKKDKDITSTVVKATSCHSDLVPNEYEGGLTVWECGIDLATYLAKHEDFSGKTVLELGCGAGIPGICAMYLKADEVHFQDYNREVLEEYTIPNVEQLNKEDCLKCTCRYFSGDWTEFYQKLEINQRYDVILTAETIYNPDNYLKLHDIFSKRLKQDGVIYLAAKSNYFGVGGGTGLFVDFIEKQDRFATQLCESIESGMLGVPREILKICWKERKKITEGKE